MFCRQEKGSINSIFCAIKAKNFADQKLVDALESDQGSDHATYNTSVGIGVASTLDGLSYCVVEHVFLDFVGS